MAGDSPWKLDQAAYEAAEAKGEEIARLHDCTSAPVDPFRIVDAEQSLIHIEGDDFGDAFDGRLSYVGPRFLLCYNTKYDRWPHRGSHHPRTRFTIAHELGHFFLEEHRRTLVLRKATHASFTEFAASTRVERQADSFASGLLMPKYLLAPRINQESDPEPEVIRALASEFEVSMTGLLVRWVRLSHFPCATLCIREGRIAWGFVSAAFRESGLWRARRGDGVHSSPAARFIGDDPAIQRYREGRGHGQAEDWIESSGAAVPVREFYWAIPYSEAVMVFLSADEGDLPISDGE